MKNYKLHLIRHGLTQGNLDGKYIGSTDLPLCPQGIEQLNNLKKAFVYPDVEAVFTSPLKRAVETSEILFPKIKLYELKDLREINFGEFEGKSAIELVKNANYARWMDVNDDFYPEGAENAREFTNRTKSTILKIFEFMMKSKVQEAACVTHGGVIMSALAQIAIPERPANMWACDPGCGYTIVCTTSMLMRDEMAEAICIVPYGYGEEGRVNSEK